MTAFNLEASVAAASDQQAEGCVKTADDLDRYRTVIATIQPRLIIETGTFSGKSALWLAQTADCAVVTIDVADQVPDDVKKAWAGRVHPIIGSSTDTAVIHAVSQMLGTINDFVQGESPVMVVLDSDHSGPHVLQEMQLYGPLVTVGSYMVVEDGILRWLPEEERAVYGCTSPLDAIETWMEQYADAWTVDRDIEGMTAVTMHPSGWLRRL